MSSEEQQSSPWTRPWSWSSIIIAAIVILYVGSQVGLFGGGWEVGETGRLYPPGWLNSERAWMGQLSTDVTRLREAHEAGDNIGISEITGSDGYWVPPGTKVRLIDSNIWGNLFFVRVTGFPSLNELIYDTPSGEVERGATGWVHHEWLSAGE